MLSTAAPHRQTHTHSHSPVSFYNFISVLAAVFIPCSSSAGLISAAGRLPPPSLSPLSLAVCVTCAAIWPRIMSSVRYLEPVCICISSCGCWHPLQKERRREKNGSRPYRAGLVSCSLSWLIQLNEIPQRRHLNCLQRTHTDTGEVPLCLPPSLLLPPRHGFMPL